METQNLPPSSWLSFKPSKVEKSIYFISVVANLILLGLTFPTPLFVVYFFTGFLPILLPFVLTLSALAFAKFIFKRKLLFSIILILNIALLALLGTFLFDYFQHPSPDPYKVYF